MPPEDFVPCRIARRVHVYIESHTVSYFLLNILLGKHTIRSAWETVDQSSPSRLETPSNSIINCGQCFYYLSIKNGIVWSGKLTKVRILSAHGWPHFFRPKHVRSESCFLTIIADLDILFRTNMIIEIPLCLCAVLSAELLPIFHPSVLSFSWHFQGDKERVVWCPREVDQS